MIEVIPAGDKRIYVTNLGSSDGNFSERLDPMNGPGAIMRLRALHGATSSERIVADGDYGAYVSNAQPGVHLSRASAGLMTDRVGHNIVLAPADCIPIAIWALGGAAIALVHAGRRELDHDAVRKTVALMCGTYGLRPAELGAYLGPGIRAESYILPADVELQHKDWPKHVGHLPGNQITLDTYGFAREQLIAAGLEEGNIFDCGVNTVTSDEFHSHYRSTRPNQPVGPGPGRNGASVIMLPLE